MLERYFKMLLQGVLLKSQNALTECSLKKSNIMARGKLKRQLVNKCPFDFWTGVGNDFSGWS